MFGIDSNELLVIAVVALVVIGPKDLPRVMRVIGQWVGRARGMAKHFRSGLDTMIRESELADMEKKWKSDNERIMREFPSTGAPPPAHEADWGKPAPPPALEGGEAPPPAKAAPKPVRAKSSRPKPPPAKPAPPPPVDDGA